MGRDVVVDLKQLQYFIAQHRDKLPVREDKEKLTFHGLRHSYAVNKFNELICSGYSEWQAKKEVSLLLGHERGDVTEIYLASVNKEYLINEKSLYKAVSDN